MIADKPTLTRLKAWCRAEKSEIHQQRAALNSRERVADAFETIVDALLAQPAPGHFADPVLEANRDQVNALIEAELDEREGGA